MKTKEEIEQLSSKRFTIKQLIGEDDYNRSETIAARYGYIEGYSQCQEDMIDKKYTEKQLLDAMSFAECYIIEHDKPLFLKSDGKPTPDCLEYINSLNKQD